MRGIDYDGFRIGTDVLPQFIQIRRQAVFFPRPPKGYLAADAAEVLLTDGPTLAMNKFNNSNLLDSP